MKLTSSRHSSCKLSNLSSEKADVRHGSKMKVTSAGKNFHFWVHVFGLGAAARAFPGFCNGSDWVLSYERMCVRSLRVSQTSIYFSFFRATTCRVDLLVWKAMGGIVCSDAVYHSLTSLLFPFIHALIICCSPGSSSGNSMLHVRLQLRLLMFQQHSLSPKFALPVLAATGAVYHRR